MFGSLCFWVCWVNLSVVFVWMGLWNLEVLFLGWRCRLRNVAFDLLGKTWVVFLLGGIRRGGCGDRVRLG